MPASIHRKGVQKANGFPRAFTLIELLVVITIIVVLLALLTPALDKAIYQAELTVCGARLAAVADGANTYAMEFRRSYPDRSAGLATGDYRPTRVAHPAANENIMKMVEGYIPVKMMADPLSPPVEIDKDSEPTPGTVFVDANYAFYFGWRFPQTGGAGMTKIGSRFSYPATRSDGTRKATHFSVIAGGQDYIDTAGTVLSAHPDEDGVLTESVTQNDLSPGHSVLLATPNGQYTVSYYFGTTGTRGDLSMNYAYVDGSVQRVNGLEDGFTPSEGMAKVPVGNGGGDTVHLPIQ